MKKTFLAILTFALFAMKVPVVANDARGAVNDAIPGDGFLRYYRLAIPVTKSSFEQDLDASDSKVYAFWQECEEFVNKMFVPLGICFDVVEDKSLIMQESNLIDENIDNAPSFGTELLDAVIGSDAYDVGMWVVHRDDYEENSGLSVLKGVYSSNTKGSGYAKTDKWVVAHEIGHLFGAVHTLQGEGSLMDNIGEFFSYPSIKAIRSCVKGATAYSSKLVDNNAPKFDADKMKAVYRIPQGACLSIDVQVADDEGHKLMYTAIGCNSANVDNVQEGSDMVLPFASFAPQESNVINYAPIYTADLFYDDYFYQKDGTGVHEMEAGSYPLSILVNDVPSTAWSYGALSEAPFYSQYTIWETQVEIVGGAPFRASLNPRKTNYAANEQVTVTWNVNKNYFDENSRLRITMSSDYGKTFKYVLATDVPARDDSCSVTLPGINVKEVEVDFSTAVRKMNGGIIKVEEMGGVAYTLTTLSPEEKSSFVVNGGVDEDNTTGMAPPVEAEVHGGYYDLQGRKVQVPVRGIYVKNGKKVLVGASDTLGFEPLCRH